MFDLVAFVIDFAEIVDFDFAAEVDSVETVVAVALAEESVAD